MVKSADFDSAIRRFESYIPNHISLCTRFQNFVYMDISEFLENDIYGYIRIFLDEY